MPYLVNALMLLSLTLASITAHANNESFSQSLRSAVQSYLEQNVAEYLARSQVQGRAEISVNRLDPRLSLPICDQALSITLESPAQPIGRVTTRVRCDGASPWTVFVPAQVKLFREVLVASRPLTRNHLLTGNDALLAERDVSLLNQGYLTEPAQAIGSRLNRALQADQIILSQHLDADDVIRKGDEVVISAQTGQVNVRMPGIAMTAGSLGQQINVQNLRSKRVVRARVTGPGQVEVAL